MATTHRIDTRALYFALDRRREEQNMSWRQVARAIGTSPANLTRLHQGAEPKGGLLLSMAAWLSMSADSFSVPNDGDPDPAARGRVITRPGPVHAGR